MYSKLWTCLIVLVLLFTSTAFAQEPITQYETSIIAINDDFGINLNLGDSVDLSNWQRPLRKIASPLLITQSASGNKDIEKTLKFVDYSYTEVLNEEDKKALFSTALGSTLSQLFDFDLNVKSSNDTQKKQQAIFYIFTAVTDERHLTGNQINWTSAGLNTLTALDGDADPFYPFTNKYGTHFIGSIKYGIRAAVCIRFENASSSKAHSLALAIKNIFTGSVENGMVKGNNRDKEILKNEKLFITVKILSGGNGVTKAPITLTSVEEAKVFWDSLSKDRDWIPAPISATAYHYTTILPDMDAIAPAVTSFKVIPGDIVSDNKRKQAK